ncbi:MAG: bifunctional precorrin-2 dehydrogenase/sirohydrochlorin ferrochelatase [Megasphaera sp.]|nr:bifunctional precorrin-2 dehydrogenase/sirohydrochlorin ferrochelatase [Megasphaera sp.]MCH4188137.1 bifunctional precorrin-2 dehydrogenase/sirohydrochlorin ferrochelatase [Megasphaera sp.]MCH4217975.1 bifunctional precorrin-2 dehydrogenase/sirohydrochlorin ferrochelatase [Megasphaera sp.]
MYPINLTIEHKPCLIIGGGPVAAKKADSLLTAGADVTIISPVLCQELETLHQQKPFCWQSRLYQTGDEAGYFLVICACGDESVNQAVWAAASANNQLLNVCDEPDLCNFTAPSVLHRGDLQISIATNGKSPALSRWLCQRLSEEISPAYGPWLEALGRIRKEAKKQLPTSLDRQNFWRTVLTADLITLAISGNLEQAEELLKQQLQQFASTYLPR